MTNTCMHRVARIESNSMPMSLKCVAVCTYARIIVRRQRQQRGDCVARQMTVGERLPGQRRNSNKNKSRGKNKNKQNSNRQRGVRREHRYTHATIASAMFQCGGGPFADARILERNVESENWNHFGKLLRPLTRNMYGPERLR